MDVSSAGADLLSAFEDRRVLLARGKPVAVYTHRAGTLVLTSCSPSSDPSTIVYQPGCVDWMRRPSAWNAARSPESSVGEVASA